VDEDVVNVDPYKDSRLPIFADQDPSDPKARVVTFSVPTTGEVVHYHGALEVRAGAGYFTKEGGSKASRGAGAVPSAHWESIVAQQFPGAWVDDAQVLVLILAGFEHVKIFAGVHNG
jgi:hypothetical protein